MNERDRQALREIVDVRRRDRFDAGFVDRTVARWRAERSASLETVVVGQFRRLVPLAAAAAIILAAYNVAHRQTDQGQTLVAALFGIAPRVANPNVVSIEQLYGLDTSLSSGGD